MTNFDKNRKFIEDNNYIFAVDKNNNVGYCNLIKCENCKLQNECQNDYSANKNYLGFPGAHLKWMRAKAN